MADYRNHAARYNSWFFRMAALFALLFWMGGQSPAAAESWFDRFLGSEDRVGRIYASEKASRLESVESAQAAFERATEAGAEHVSPYEYYMAQEYLELAQDEYREGDRIGVHDFALKSEQFSLLAIQNATGGGK